MGLARTVSGFRVVFAVVLRHLEEHVAPGAPRLGVAAAGVEGQVEALALLYGGGVPVAASQGPGGGVLGPSVGEQEVVGHVLAAGRGLLG